MYKFTDENVDLPIGIEPEYTASYCASEREVTCFVDNITADSFRNINTITAAQEIAELWFSSLSESLLVDEEASKFEAYSVEDVYKLI